jgi:cell division transport system permease protein
MIFTHTKRIIRAGFINFWRNGFLSFSAIVVITLSLVVFGALIFGSAFGRAMIKEVKSKIDINVYFILDAEESDILALKKTIENLPEVDKVEYISRAQALEDFKEKWKDNTLILQGLDEIGDNPFPAVLNIKAKEPSQYAGIAHFLDSKNSSTKNGISILEKVNYNQNKLIIERLGRIIPAVEKVGSIIAIILVAVAVVITINTIRLIIFTAKDEISVMKLVGASNIYIRGPFVISGIMYGIFSAVLTLVILGAFAYYSDLLIMKLAGVQGANDFDQLISVFSLYFKQNFAQIFGIIMGSGIVLGAISSYMAVKRYLRI